MKNCIGKGLCAISQTIVMYVHVLLYRHVVTTYGLWDQIRVDKGREWYLLLFINEMMATYRYNTRKSPHLQTSSTKVKSMANLSVSYIQPPLEFWDN